MIKRNRNISLELIADQFNDPFTRELDAVHEAIRQKVSTITSTEAFKAEVVKGKFDEYSKKIEDLVAKRLGLGVNLLMSDQWPVACCLPFQMSNNVLFLQIWKGVDIDEQLKEHIEFASKNNFKEFTIDYKKAHISGPMSKYPAMLNMHYFYLFNIAKLSVRETSAVIMHELGHLFTWIDMGSRTDRTNQIMNQISNSIKNKEPASKRKVLLVALEKNKAIDNKDLEDLAKEERPMMLTTKLYGKIFNQQYNSAISTLYADTTSETLADDLATKFGYGADLATSLVKITNAFTKDAETFSLIVNSWNIFIAIEQTFLALAGAVFQISIFSVVINIILTAWSFIMARMYRYTMTYDDFKNRIDRIRRACINILKDPMLTADSKRSLISQIETIEAVQESYKDDTDYRSDDMVSYIYRLVSSERKQIDFEIILERSLEHLMNNKLFTMAAKLSVLNKK